MYSKLEEALDMLSFIQNHSKVSSQLARVAGLAIQSIEEYIEEGYLADRIDHP